MKRQLAKVHTSRGTYTVVLDDTVRARPYKVYLDGYGTDGNRHKTLKSKFGNYYSAMDYITDRIER